MDWVKKTDDFHKFRGKGIGSSDMPIIMGLSPWKKPFTLWQEKTGKKKNTFKGNSATKRGNDLEPMVRAWYNNEFTTCMIPERVVHNEYEYLRANADGVDHGARRMIEIKCGNLPDHVDAHTLGKIPDKYYPQVMYLSYLFGYPIDYVSYNPDLKEAPFVVIQVKPDPDFTKRMLSMAHGFWEKIKSGQPPLIDDSEDVIVDDDDNLHCLVDRWEYAKERVEHYEQELEETQGLIAEAVVHKKTICNGHRIVWVYRKNANRYLLIKKAKDA